MMGWEYFSQEKGRIFVVALISTLWPLGCVADAHRQAVDWMDTCLSYASDFAADVDLSDPDFEDALRAMEATCAWTPVAICRFETKRHACVEGVVAAQRSRAEGRIDPETDCATLSFARRMSFAPIGFTQFCESHKAATNMLYALQTERAE